MKCKCGASIPVKAKFCSECGTPAPKLEPLPEPKNEEILTTYEAAEFLKISRWKIYDLTWEKANSI